jgi:hypothetical protein
MRGGGEHFNWTGFGTVERFHGGKNTIVTTKKKILFI